MSSPLSSPENNWWNIPVSWYERVWLIISVCSAVVLFAVMVGWSWVGDQNQIGTTYRTSPTQFQDKLSEYQQAGTRTKQGLRPEGEDVYIGAQQFAFQGLPVVLEAGKEYQFHMSSLDVQHGFSVRPEDALSKQMTLQFLPGYEWVLPMEFEEPGTYHVVCNEFCGVGHRVMHGTFIVRE